MKKDNDFPYGGILILISFVNIIFSTYFIAFFLAGVVFKIFLVSLKKQHYYILTFSIFTFLLIEVVQGLKPFLFTGVSLLLYYIVIPKIKHTFSSSLISEFIFIFLFYFATFMVTIFFATAKIDIVLIFLVNFIIDIIIVGLII